MLAAVVAGTRPLYFSRDAGATWSERGPTLAWSQVTMSADGRRVYANSGGAVYGSSDYGSTFSRLSASVPCWGLYTSADGQVVAGGGCGRYVYLSTNYGVTWSSYSIPYCEDQVEAMTLSRDGSVVYFFTYSTWYSSCNGYNSRSLYALRRSGTSYFMSRTAWTRSGVHGSLHTSANGAVILTGSGAGASSISKDSGGTWTVLSGSGSGPNWAFAISANGQTIARIRPFSPSPTIWRSTDGGTSWEQITPFTFPSGTVMQDLPQNAYTSSDGRALAMAFKSSSLPVVSVDGARTWAVQAALPGTYTTWTMNSMSMSDGE